MPATRSKPCVFAAGLVRDVRGGDPAGAVEHALAGLDRGAWGGGLHSPLAATLRLPVDELLHCRSVRTRLLPAVLEALKV